MTQTEAVMTWIICMLLVVGVTLFVLTGNAVARTRVQMTLRAERVAEHCARRGVTLARWYR